MVYKVEFIMKGCTPFDSVCPLQYSCNFINAFNHDLHMGLSKKIPPFYRKVISIFLNSTCVIVLFYLPIHLNENYFVDMRLVPLAFLAYLQGWIAIPALLIASTWRFFMGGRWNGSRNFVWHDIADVHRPYLPPSLKHQKTLYRKNIYCSFMLVRFRFPYYIYRTEWMGDF